MKRSIGGALALLFCVGILGGCAAEKTKDGQPESVQPVEAGDYSVTYKEIDTDAAVEATVRHITLAGDTVTFDGADSLASVSGSTVTVKRGGTYVVSGTLADGQLIVDEPGEETVRLVLENVDITCSTGAPIWVKEAKKVVLVLPDGTENTVNDTGEWTDSADEDDDDNDDDIPNAAIFSKADLSITGTGALTVNAGRHNGINSKDKLKITGGVIAVTAAANGIKGKDCVAMAGGTVTVTAERDGIKSSNTADADAGFVRIDGGTLTVTAGQDGIQAETGLLITDGAVSVTTGGGSANASTKTDSGWGHWGGFGDGQQSGGDTASAKALKAGVLVAVSGGSVAVDSSDDAIHSNGDVTVAGGVLSLASGDDGAHADNALTVSGGELTVSKSYEGLEAQVITLSGGTVRLTASDDGLNAAGGSDGSAMGGRPGQNHFSSQNSAALHITGGYLAVNADGDGLDSNGVITMSGGTVLVHGPTSNDNSAVDYERSFTFDGGTLVAAGASGMAERVTDGDGASLFITCASQTAGTPVRVEDAGGEIITFCPEKAYSSLVIATPEMVSGMVCTVYIGGSTTGSVTDGLVSGGAFAPGELSADVTLDGVSTALNMGGAPGGFGGRMDEPPGGGGGQMGEPSDGRGGQMGEPPGGFGGSIPE